MPESIDPLRLADILATSPIWARLALTAQSDRLRERAAETMAAIIIERLGEPARRAECPGETGTYA